jgi:general secretion pathway protein K
MRSRPKDPAGERGIALLTVLWALALLSAMAVVLAGTARTEAQIAHNHYENARARSLAEAGISLAIVRFLDPDPRTQWRADGGEHAFSYGGGNIRVSLKDEAGKVDLNAAPDELIAGLFTVVGVQGDAVSRLSHAIADWKDADDLRHALGAEASDYARAGLSYGPRNAPFQSVEELRLVLGMTALLYEQVEPFVTIHSPGGRINPLSAAPEVLRALPGAQPAQINAHLQARGSRVSPLKSAALPSLTGVDQYISAGLPNAVTIRAEAVTDSGATFIREAIVAATRNARAPYAMLGWRQIAAKAED